MSLKFREGNIIFKGYRSGFTNPLEVHIDYTKFDESAPFESLELLIDKITENIIKHRFNIFIGDKAQEFIQYKKIIYPYTYNSKKEFYYCFYMPIPVEYVSVHDINKVVKIYFKIKCVNLSNGKGVDVSFNGGYFFEDEYHDQCYQDDLDFYIDRTIIHFIDQSKGKFFKHDFIIETCNQSDKPEKPEILYSGPDKLNDTGNCPLKCHGKASVREKEDSKNYEFYKSTSLDAPHKLVLKNRSSFAFNPGKCFVETISKELLNRRDNLITENICSVTFLLHTLNDLADNGLEVLYASGDSYQSWDNHSIFAGFTNDKISEELRIVFEDVKPSIILSDEPLQFDWSGTFRVFQPIETRFVDTNKSEINKYFTRHNRLDCILALDFLRDILSPERYQEICDFCNNKSVDDFVKRDAFCNTVFDKFKKVHYLRINDIFYNKEKCHHFTYFLLEDKLDSKNEYEDSKYSLYTNTYYDRIYNVKPVCYLNKV